MVLNGSPKGDNSVTMSYIKYLEIEFPEHAFKFRYIAQTINQLEKDNEKFDALMHEISQCDVVLWAFPLYFMLAHSNYKRFIELLFERNRQAVFLENTRPLFRHRSTFMTIPHIIIFREYAKI